MSQAPIKIILRNAVIAALPLALQTGCMTPAAKPPPEIKPPVDRCALPGPVSRPGQQSSIKELLSSSKPAPLSKGECAALCESLIVKRSQQPGRTTMVGMEDLKVTSCDTTAGAAAGQVQLDCEVTFTSINQEYAPAPPGCPPRPVPGRMPAGAHIQAPDDTASVLGEYFSSMAAMETAAVTAFRYLTRELEAYQAPEALIAMACQAVQEEIEHAEMAGLLSQAYDAAVPTVEVDDFQLRSLFEVALENAVEGCVNETFAAACGIWQHQHAELDAFKAVMGRVAEEESGHAELSWGIHQWIMPQLTEAQQQHIRAAQAEAIESLHATFQVEENPQVRRAVGLPESADALRLLGELRGQLWEAHTA